jgi:hypothetical protein
MHYKYIISKCCFLLVLFHVSCICPDGPRIEFTNSSKRITLLKTDEYYIKKVRITEYIPAEKHIVLIDSSYIEFLQNGNREATDLSLLSIGENYIERGDAHPQLFFTKKNLYYSVTLERFEYRKRGALDTEVISFTNASLEEKNIFQSKHPCP